jgi:hypothetical protein
MKIILSRKGMDSSFGLVPSPVLPDGRLFWLPIPESSASKRLVKYSDIDYSGINMGDVIHSLSSGKICAEATSHLDPDLNFNCRDRAPGWRPIFGQTGVAEKHLRNRGVEIGDIFLFFGWFRQAVWVNGRLHYEKSAPDMHVIYGWLQVGDILDVEDLRGIPSWATDHPHLHGPRYNALDVVYVASDKINIFGEETVIPGGGVFEKIDERLILTEYGKNRSMWKLPNWFFPKDNKQALSYHEKLSRWSVLPDGSASLQVASRGQEFVLDTEYYPEAEAWVHNIIDECARGVL